MMCSHVSCRQRVDIIQLQNVPHPVEPPPPPAPAPAPPPALAQAANNDVVDLCDSDDDAADAAADALAGLNVGGGGQPRQRNNAEMSAKATVRCLAASFSITHANVVDQLQSCCVGLCNALCGLAPMSFAGLGCGALSSDVVAELVLGGLGSAPLSSAQERQHDGRLCQLCLSARHPICTMCSECKQTCLTVECQLQALANQLMDMAAAGATNKALIFTSFHESHEQVRSTLQQLSLRYQCITGKHTQKQRTNAIQAFQNDPDTTVMVISVRSGAVGINLTAANFVFFMDPLMSGKQHAQAVGRAWRMGQQRPVTVKQLYVPGTVEERILRLRARQARPRICALLRCCRCAVSCACEQQR